MKLEPCPFCGSGVLHKNNPEKMGYTFFVSCGFCDCRGACLPTEQGAVEAWNTRAAAIPEGYVVVPVEPTEAMIKAARLAYMSGDGAYSETYKAMIAAGE